MPELPEVETVARSLKPYLEDRTITGFKAVWPKVVGNMSRPAFARAVTGRRIVSLTRRAKYLILNLDQGFVLYHLRMTGKLYPLPQAPRGNKHVSAWLELSDGQFLIFDDFRKFGRITYYPDAEALEEFSRRFGPEPLGRAFTADWLTDNLTTRNRMIKPLLLDQEFIAGLGNIYVDEALWESRIHPLASSRDISKQKGKALHAAIQMVLRESIKANGTSFMDFKFLGGEKGGYTDNLRVFARDGEGCNRCGREILKIRVAQRGTHYCPACQKDPNQRGNKKS